ncbi:MAG: hypothetical protein AVDCRST_MAG41-435, partial [uncultured Corynebacteriales bacterium]
MTMSAPAATDRAFWAAVAERSPFVLPAAWAPPPGAGGPAGEWREAAVPFADLLAGLADLADRADRADLATVLLAAHLTVLGQLTPDQAARSDLLGPVGAGDGPPRPVPVPVRREPATWRELVAA